METVRLVLESGFVLDLPGEMFYGHAPRLRNLSLCGAFLAWDARILDGASHMRVFVVDVIMRRRVASGRYTLQGEYSDDGWPEDQAELEPVADAEDAHVAGDDPLLDQYPPNPDSRIPKLARLLDILDGMPRLEELRLEGVIPIHDRMRPPGTPRITSLSHLTRLTLSGPILGCVQLINALDLPGLESFHYFCILPVQGRTSTAVAALLPFLTKHCSRSNEAWRPVHTLEIRSTVSYELQIRAPAGDPCRKPQSDGLANFQSDDDIFNVEFRLFEPSLHTQGRILETVLSALPVSNTLQRIFIHGFGRVSQNRWVRALGHCTELREVHLGKATLQLLEALGSGLDNPSIFLPKLELLELRGSRLNHRCPHGGPVLEVLFRVLEERKRRGGWLEVLNLRSAWHTKAQQGEIASKDLARVVQFNPTTKPQRARYVP
ncbi:hypothetical protein EWM64_g5052 [Hericium alpestre]|uniref:F-box domain-containing protein n=1 Tax=Hericium alpestre TaxID=135208 RepID=A0A4Y9ZXQ2_9AGAM|nr:hypothetical protein EWM64_g5052 [Hericium alpestre]